MNIRPHTFVRIIFLMFSWKCGKVRSEPTMKTWKQAVLDCYENNSFLESNTTVLKQYMVNHTKVNDSIWVGSFGTLLPWIEIRGRYFMKRIHAHGIAEEFDLDFWCLKKRTNGIVIFWLLQYTTFMQQLRNRRKNAANIQLCQLKCMERRYFAFNKKIESCVCFDEHDLVKKETDNASFCQECIDRGDCNTHVVVYKVFNRPITLAGNNDDCLSYQCTSSSSMPILSTKECFTYSRSYCRDGRRADGPDYQHFFQHRSNCEESHLTYPLLYTENLCNVSESLKPGIDVWVGVYRQKIYMDNSDKTVLDDFNKIEQYISHCNYLPTNESLLQADNCSVKHFYKCSSDTLLHIQEEPYNNNTSIHVCRFEDTDVGNTHNQSSGIIAGTVTSMLVIVIVGAIVVFTYRRFNSKSSKRKYSHSEGEPKRNNIQIQKAAGDKNVVVSTIVDASNITKKTINAIANPGYNGLQVNVDTQIIQNGDQQGLNSMANTMSSADYCLAKPTDPVDLTLYTDNTDYDHLNSVKHHQEKDNVNVYDHVPNIVDSDDTDDHSTINIRTSESNNYDHFDVQN